MNLENGRNLWETEENVKLLDSDLFLVETKYEQK